MDNKVTQISERVSKLDYIEFEEKEKHKKANKVTISI